MTESPDLSCEVCGFLIHHQCSPWIGMSPRAQKQVGDVGIVKSGDS